MLVLGASGDVPLYNLVYTMVASVCVRALIENTKGLTAPCSNTIRVPTRLQHARSIATKLLRRAHAQAIMPAPA